MEEKALCVNGHSFAHLYCALREKNNLKLIVSRFWLFQPSFSP